MFTNLKAKSSEKDQRQICNEIKKMIDKADKIVIGAGSGLSASAGINYSDELFFKEYYPLYFEKGYRHIADAISDHWYLTKENARTYWGFWSRHIYNIYYRIEQLETYKNLYEVIKDKNYFVITTNVDDQFYRGNFDPNKVFAMQGSYGKFQCSQNCHNKVYDNKKFIEAMLDSMDDYDYRIKEECIPSCPVCGELLRPNLRIDHMFTEANSLDNRLNYVEFLSSSEERIILVELGVGYNTPVVIRYPFDELSSQNKNISLIRVNMNLAGPSSFEDGNIYTNQDAHELIKMIKG